jgi:Flp pilus assembly protein TadB
MIPFAVSLGLAGLLLASAVAMALGRIDFPAPRVIRPLEFHPKKVALALALGVVVGLVTHLVVVALSVAALPYVAPALKLKNPQARSMAKLEAVIEWAEALRDAVRTSGIEEALRRASTTRSSVISDELARLVHNLDPKVGMSTGKALRTLADDLDDPSADTVIAPLVLAVEQHAKGLPDMLSALSRAGRAELTMRGRIEAQRAPLYLQVRMVVWFSILFFALLMIVARGYMAPFATPLGEVFLGLAIGCYGAGLVLMLRMVRPVPEPRLLAEVER